LLTSFRAHGKRTYITGLEWLSTDSLLSAGLDGEIKTWKIEDSVAESKRQTIATSAFSFSRQKSIIDRIAVSADRTQLLTICIDQRVEKMNGPETYLLLWRIGERKSIGRIRLASPNPELKPHAEAKVERVVSAVTWSADGTKAYVAVHDKIPKDKETDIEEEKTDSTIQVVDIASLRVTEVLASRSRITDLALGGVQESMLATFDGTVAQLWNIADGSLLRSCRPQRRVSALALSQDVGHTVLAMGTDSLLLFNSEQGSSFGQTLAKARLGQKKRITTLAFSPVSQDFQLATGSEDGTVKVWKWAPATQTLSEESSFEVETNEPVSEVRWTSGGESLLVVRRNSVAMINIVESRETALELPKSVTPMTFLCGDITADGTAIALAGEQKGVGSAGLVLKKNAEGLFLLHSTFEGHGFGGIKALSFIPSTEKESAENLEPSPYLVSGGDDGAALLWNWHPSRESSGFPATEAFRFFALYPSELTDAHRGAINDLAVTATGFIVTGSEDGTAVVWRNPLAGPPADTQEN
jgi:WD40 repeat protein